MDKSAQQVLALYRAEFDDAKRIAGVAAICDWASASLAAVALFTTIQSGLYFLAIAVAICGGVSAYCRLLSNARKTSAERGRRAVVLSHGLGKTIQGKELSDLLTSFRTSSKKAAKWADPSYYASTDEPGPMRLARMVQESAFWSRCLYNLSARRAWLFAALFVLVSLGLLLTVVVVPSIEWRVKLAQVSCLVVTTLLARDHIGRAIAFMGAANEANSIDQRLESLLIGNCAIEDVLLAVGDYNCAVESSPLITTRLYRKQKEELTRIWAHRSRPE